MAAKRTCGAKTRAGGRCKRPAGWGTNHAGEGRCKLHGGKSPGGKPGNKNAVTTGAYETIWADQLEPHERELLERVDVSPRAQVEEEIRLLTIRERRMLKRIAELANDPDPTGLVGADRVQGWNQGKIDVTTLRSEANLERIMRVEQALTRVQAQKTRAIEQLRRIEAAGAGELDLDVVIEIGGAGATR